MPELYKYSYRVLKLDLTTGLTDFELPIHAEKVVYASPTDGPELSIRLQAKSNDQIPLRPQGEIVAPFQRLYISAAAVAKTVFLLIGSPGDIQLTGRDVAISGVIAQRNSQEYALSIGQLFSIWTERTAIAGVHSQTQILNPTGSGKTVWVLETLITNSNAAPITVYVDRFDTPLTIGGAFGFNHTLGGAAPLVQSRNEATAASWGSVTFAQDVPSFNSVKFASPFLLAAGRGLRFTPAAVNQGIRICSLIWEF